MSPLFLAPALAGGVALAALGPNREDPSLSVGPVLRGDRARPVSLKGGAAFAGEFRAVWRLNLRVDLVTGWETADALRVKGPVLGALAVYHQTFDIYAADIALGPTLWLGRSQWWEGAFPGPFPGFRAALGTSVRPRPWVGGRLELGMDRARSSLPLLSGVSTGFDARLMITGFVPDKRYWPPKRNPQPRR